MKPRQNNPKVVSSFDLLNVFAASLKLQLPTYRFKYKQFHRGESRKYTKYRKYTAIVVFDGKFFESRIQGDNKPDSREHAANEALKYLGFRDIIEAGRLRDHMWIQRLPYCKMPFRIESPFSFCPSKQPSWVFDRFDPIDEMSGEKVTHKNDTLNIIQFRKLELHNWTSDEIFSQAMDVKPCLGDQQLSNITDLCVGEMNKENKSKLIVGNNECSFSMFCEDGRIMCNKIKSQIEVLPGHNVCGLKCTYELMYPSLQVYLKAESCDDLVYPKAPLPVVSACGVTVLMHDHEANTKDVHILLTRQLHRKTFITKVRNFASYLRRQLSNRPRDINNKDKFNVAECLENITSWTLKEVQLMSEMTAESIHELISLHTRYEEQWNETFVKEHTDVLKELKAVAEAELVRRTEEGIEGVEEECNEPWSLPSTQFQHRLLATGVFVETSPLCAFRSIIRTAGVKVKLSDIEESPTIDLPTKGDVNVHKGDVCRYYIWKGLRKVSGDEEEPYYTLSSVLEKLDAAYGDDNSNTRKNKKNRRSNFKSKEKQRKRKLVDTGNKTDYLENVSGAPKLMKGDLKSGENAVELMEEDKLTGENTPELVQEDQPQSENALKLVEEDKIPGENAPELAEEDQIPGENEPDLVEEDERLGENAPELADDDEIPGEPMEPMEKRKKQVLGKKRPFMDHVTKVYTESRWFPLEEAKLLCATLKELSENPIFQKQVKELQLEANEFENTKAVVNSV